MNSGVVSEAKKYLDTVDFVVDLYDKSFVWVNEGVLRVAGYSLEEFTKLHTVDTLDKSVDQEAYIKELSDELKDKHGTTTVLCNTKEGKKVRLTVEYHIFEYSGGWYRAAKGLKVEMLP